MQRVQYSGICKLILYSGICKLILYSGICKLILYSGICKLDVDCISAYVADLLDFYCACSHRKLNCH